jgi:hypothetical protein
MKFMMLVYWDSAQMDDSSDYDDAVAARRDDGGPADADDDSFPWLDDVLARGVRLDGDRLAPPRAAATVRVREGRQVVTDGPFAETKEAIAGFDILECADLNEAIQIAAAHPVAQIGSIEVRPFWP